MRCWCQEYWKIGLSEQYHDEKGNPVLAIQYIIYCDHMGGARQIFETPLPFNEIEERKLAKILEVIVGDRKIVEELIRNGKYTVKSEPCPICLQK